MVGGDNNTKFFHAFVNQRRKKSMTYSLKLPNGEVLDSMEAVHEGAVRYFQNFLTGAGPSRTAHLADIISPVVSEEENTALCRAPSEMEVRDAILSIPRNSSPGPDGFGSVFFQDCWNIVKEEVIEAARDFFAGSPLPRFYAASYIVLIPKVPNPQSFNKFRPISLCSVIYKIFFKDYCCTYDRFIVFINFSRAESLHMR